MRTVGKRVVCDRCGTEIFLKYTSSDSLDGGYTKLDKFEDYPEGWAIGQDVIGKGFVDLCPTCAIEAKELSKKFMENCVLVPL